MNVGTEVFGILLTVWLIDAVVRRIEERERERVRIIVSTQSRIPILHHALLLLQIYKASVANAPTDPPMTFKELFGHDYATQLAFCDLNKSAPIMPARTWYQHVHNECQTFQSCLSQTIEKYAVFMEIETLEIMEEMKDSSFARLLLLASSIPQVHGQMGIDTSQCRLFTGPGMPRLISDYTDQLQKLIEQTNRRLTDDKKIRIHVSWWRDDFSPKYGSAR